MAGKSRIHTIQDSVGYHIPGAFKSLLRRLKHQPDPASQRGLILFEHLCRCQQHGRVEVVAAGMGFGTGGTGETLAALLRHGQRIHVRPEQERPSLFHPQFGGHTMAARTGGQAAVF